MKRFALLLCLLFIAGPAISGDVVKLAIGEWAPYTSDTDPKHKLLERVVTEAFKLEGIDVAYAYFPWLRSELLVEDCDFDGTFPWRKTKAHELKFYMNNVSLVKNESVLFHLKKNPIEWNVLDNLKKYKLGVTNGFGNEAFYKAHGIPATAVQTEELNFKRVLNEQIDAYGVPKTVGYHILERLFSPEDVKKFTTHPKSTEHTDYYAMFSKTPSGKRFAEKLDAGLKKLKASGAYDKLMMQ